TGAAGKEEAVKVLIDGKEIPAAAIGVPRAVDAGQHVVVANVDYGKGANATVTLAEGKQATVPLTVRVDEPPPGVVRVKTPQPGGPTTITYNPMPRKIGIGLMAAGGALLLGGIGTGAAVIAMHGSLKTNCPNSICPASQQSKLSTYNALGIVSTGG